MQKIIWYFNKTADIALCYRKCSKPMVAYADASWGNKFEISDPMDTITAFRDSQSANKLLYTPVFQKRFKHINIRNYFIRELAKTDLICIKYLETKDWFASLCANKGSRQAQIFVLDGTSRIKWGY